MSSHDGLIHQSRRDFLRKALPAGAVCAGCPGLLKLDLPGLTDGGGQEVHKFLQDSGMTRQQVFEFAYGRMFIPMLKGLGEGTDREEYLENVGNIIRVLEGHRRELGGWLEHLEGYLAAELGVLGGVDISHTAGAELSQNLVMSESSTDHGNLPSAGQEGG